MKYKEIRHIGGEKYELTLSFYKNIHKKDGYACPFQLLNVFLFVFPFFKVSRNFIEHKHHREVSNTTEPICHTQQLLALC